MSLTNIKTNLQKERGFTIVELLIVIVVIAILAAITIVSYNGVTANANGTKAQTNAASTQKVVEAYATEQTSTGYPDITGLRNYAGTTRLPNGLIVSNNNGSTGNTALSATNGTTTVLYGNKGTTGACIGWWDFRKSSSQLTWLYVGDATTGGTGGTNGLVTCS